METKIPFYNILNMFLTGLVFIGVCEVLFPEHILTALHRMTLQSFGTGSDVITTVCMFAIAYEAGLVINRVGSILLEPILTKLKCIPFNKDYVLFNEKKKKYPIMDTLSRECAVSRTRIVLFLSLSVLFALVEKWEPAWVCFGLIVVYYFSWRKHSTKITKLMEENNFSTSNSVL